MFLEDSNGSILIHIEVVIKYEEGSEKNIIIGSLIVVLGIWISLGIYTYQTKTTLTHYHTEVPVNHATEDIKLYSNGNDVNLVLTDDTQSNIKLNEYFSKTDLKKNDHAQKNNNHLNFNFTDNKEHTFINKRSDKQHMINFAIRLIINIRLKIFLSLQMAEMFTSKTIIKWSLSVNLILMAEVINLLLVNYRAQHHAIH